MRCARFRNGCSGRQVRDRKPGHLRDDLAEGPPIGVVLQRQSREVVPPGAGCPGPEAATEGQRMPSEVLVEPACPERADENVATQELVNFVFASRVAAHQPAQGGWLVRRVVVDVDDGILGELIHEEAHQLLECELLRGERDATAFVAGPKAWNAFCWQSAGLEPGEWMKPDFADLTPDIAATLKVVADPCSSCRSSSSPTTWRSCTTSTSVPASRRNSLAWRSIGSNP